MLKKHTIATTKGDEYYYEYENISGQVRSTLPGRTKKAKYAIIWRRSYVTRESRKRNALRSDDTESTYLTIESCGKGFPRW